MSFKRNLVIAIILLGVAGLYYGINTYKERKKTEKEEDVRLFTESIDTITGIRLGNEHGQFVLSKESGTWNIISPQNAKADQDIVHVMLSNLQGAKKTNTFETNDFKPYGLDDPQTSVTLTFKDDTLVTLFLGNESTSPGKYFARDGSSNEVFTVSSAVNNNMLKTLYDLRDKSILKSEPERVTSIALVNTSDAVNAIKDEKGEWRLTHPIEYPGNTEEINNLLRRINFAKIIEFIDDTPTSLSIYGLAEPEIQITVTQTGDDSNGKITSGVLYVGSMKNSNYYAMRHDSPEVFVIPVDVVRELKKGSSQFRQNLVFTLNMSNIDKLEIKGDTTHINLVRDEDKNWQFGENTDLRCDTAKVSSLLTQLVSSKIQKFIADNPDSWSEYGLDNPMLSCFVTDIETSTVQGIYFGDTIDLEENMYARKTGENTVISVSDRLFESLSISVEELADKRLFPNIIRNDIERIEVMESERKMIIRRKGTLWELADVTDTKSESYHSISISNVNMLLDSILNLRYMKGLTAEEIKSDNTGIETPSRTIKLLDEKKEVLVDLTFGNSTAEHTYISTGESALYTIENRSLRDIVLNISSLED